MNIYSGKQINSSSEVSHYNWLSIKTKYLYKHIGAYYLLLYILNQNVFIEIHLSENELSENNMSYLEYKHHRRWIFLYIYFNCF